MLGKNENEGNLGKVVYSALIRLGVDTVCNLKFLAGGNIHIKINLFRPKTQTLSCTV